MMTRIDECMDGELNIRDCLNGVVTDRCHSGLFITLENGQGAFASFGPLPNGTPVLCTVIRKPVDRPRVLVAIDSILDPGIAA